MKLCTFAHPSGPRLGAKVEEQVLDLSEASGGALPPDLLAFIEAGPAALEAARALLKKPPFASLRPSQGLKFLAPLPKPPALRDFFAFEAHAQAGSRRRGETLAPEWYELPVYYKGNPREVYGSGDTVPWPDYTRKLDFECEIACVVGRAGRDLTPEQARKHIFGYMIFNDLSARDIQKKEMVLRMGPAKGKDFANAFGPWLVTADEFDPRRDGKMTVRVNGEVWSEGHFKEQYWGFDVMVSHVSQGETVYPGDLFGSGTFYRGCGLDLDRWIQPGDVVELEVAGLGRLSNKIGAPKGEKRLDYRPAAERKA